MGWVFMEVLIRARGEGAVVGSQGSNGRWAAFLLRSDVCLGLGGGTLAPWSRTPADRELRHVPFRVAGAAVLFALLVAGAVNWMAAPAVEEPDQLGEEDDAPSRGPADISRPVLRGRTAGDDASRDWSVVVTVLDEDDRPVVGRDVRVLLWVKDLPGWNKTTDYAGCVRLGPFLPPMPVAGLEVHVDTKTEDSNYVRAMPSKAGSPELRAAVRLSESPSLSGWVNLPAGVPPEHAYVWVHEKYARNHDHGHINGGRLQLDEEGRFHTKVFLGETPDDVYGLEVSIAHEGRRWYGCATGTLPDNHVELSVGPLRPGDPAVVRTHVRTEDGEPIDCLTSGRFDDGMRVGFGYGADGLEDGAYCFLWDPKTEIYLHADSFDEAKGPVALGPLSADTTDVEIVFPEGRHLAGRIATKAGEGIEGVKIQAEMLFQTRRGRDLEFFGRAARSDAEGNFELRGLGPYPYVVTAAVDRNVGTVRPVDVTAFQTWVDLTVQAPTQAKITVLDDAGESLEGVRVRLRLPPRGIELEPEALPLSLDWPHEWQDVSEGETDNRGTFRFEGLDEERLYVLGVWAADRPDLAWVEIQGWMPRDETLRLASGLTIAGTVVGEGRQPTGAVSVHARPLGEAPGVGREYRRVDGSTFVLMPRVYVRPDSGGKFEIGPLPPGEYAVHADGGDEVIARAGDEGVVLQGTSRWDQIWWTVQVEDWRPEDRGAWALLGSMGGRVKALPVGPDGLLVFPHVGLDQRPDLWIVGLDQGRYVWVRKRKLTKKDDDEDLIVHSKIGASIAGTVLVPDGVELSSWRVEPIAPLLRERADGTAIGGFPCSYGADGDSFILTGVPPGSWTLTVVGERADTEYRGTVEAKPGETVVVELQPR